MSILEKLNSIENQTNISEVELMIQGGAIIFLPASDTAEEALVKVKTLYPEVEISDMPIAIVIGDNAAIELEKGDLVFKYPDSLYNYNNGEFKKIDGQTFTHTAVKLQELTDLLGEL